MYPQRRQRADYTVHGHDPSVVRRGLDIAVSHFLSLAVQAGASYEPYTALCRGEGATAEDLRECFGNMKKHNPLHRGLYADQLERWFRVFDRSQVEREKGSAAGSLARHRAPRVGRQAKAKNLVRMTAAVLSQSLSWHQESAVLAEDDHEQARRRSPSNIAHKMQIVLVDKMVLDGLPLRSGSPRQLALVLLRFSFLAFRLSGPLPSFVFY